MHGLAEAVARTTNGADVGQARAGGPVAPGRHAMPGGTSWRVSEDWYRGSSPTSRLPIAAEGRDPATFRRTIGLYGLIRARRGRGARGDHLLRRQASMPGDAMASETWSGRDTLSRTRRSSSGWGRSGRWASRRVVLAPWVLPFATRARARVGSSPTWSCFRPGLKLDVSEGGLTVLEEAENRCALDRRVGPCAPGTRTHADPFVVADVRCRRAGNYAVRQLVAEGALRRAGTGVYALTEALSGAGTGKPTAGSRSARTAPASRTGARLRCSAGATGASAIIERLRARAVGPGTAHALQQLAVGDARRREERRRPRPHGLVGGERPVEVVAGVGALARRSSSLRPGRELAPWIAPPRTLRHFSAHAITPSGVPPIPRSMSTPGPGAAATIAPATSPSVIRKTRAPTSRTADRWSA